MILNLLPKEIFYRNSFILQNVMYTYIYLVKSKFHNFCMGNDVCVIVWCDGFESGICDCLSLIRKCRISKHILNKCVNFLNWWILLHCITIVHIISVNYFVNLYSHKIKAILNMLCYIEYSWFLSQILHDGLSLEQ